MKVISHKEGRVTTHLFETEKGEWIGKTHERRDPKEIYDNILLLWNSGFSSIPRPLGYLVEPPMTFQEKVEGKPLGEWVQTGEFQSIVQKLAELLSQFHQLKVPISGKRTLEKELRRLTLKTDLLKKANPELKERIEILRKKVAHQQKKIKLISYDFFNLL